MFGLVNITNKSITTLVSAGNILLLLALNFVQFVSVANAQTGGGQVETAKLENPLNVDSIEELISGILDVVLILAVPVIVFFIIYAGFLYATARGNAAQVKQATTALTYAIIGGVLIIGAVAIAEIVKELVASFQ